MYELFSNYLFNIYIYFVFRYLKNNLIWNLEEKYNKNYLFYNMTMNKTIVNIINVRNICILIFFILGTIKLY